jgi:hypothetical protein
MNMLWMAVLLLTQWPAMAMAAEWDGIDRCPSPPHWWWGPNGPNGPYDVKDIYIQPYGEDFIIEFSVVNTGRVATAAGTPFTLTQAVVGLTGFSDPTALRPPENPQAVLGKQVVLSAQLPELRPGASTRLRGIVKGLQTGAGHILSASFYDGDMPRCGNEPKPWWIRLLVPDGGAPSDLRVVESSTQEVTSSLAGYKAFRVRVTFAYNGRVPVLAGKTVRLGHSHGSIVGYWNPEDDVDPNDPGNPYAIIFREQLTAITLTRDLQPGAIMTVEGVAHVPLGAAGNVEIVTVAVGN